MNKFKFYLLSFTWGLPMTLIGLIFACVLLCLGYRPTTHGGCLLFTVGKNHGGVSLGIVIIVPEGAIKWKLNHELGHAIQNCKYGLLMPFIVGIPSAIRYHYRKSRKKRGLLNKTGYYDIWFEKEANEYGEKYGVW